MVRIRENKKEKRDKAFREVKKCSMIHPSVLELKAFTIIQEEYLSGIRKGPDYICNVCQKCEYEGIMLTFDQSRYDQETIEKYDTKKAKCICKTCDNSMKKK